MHLHGYNYFARTTQSVEDLDVVFTNIEYEIKHNIGASKNKQYVDGVLFAKVGITIFPPFFELG